MRHTLLVVAPSVALAVAGCNSLLGIDDLELAGDGGPVSDDGGHDAPPGTVCYGTLVTTCLPPAQGGVVELSGTLDTGTDPRCIAVPQDIAVEVCAIHASGFSIGAGGLIVRGPRPLMLVADSTIRIEYPVSVGSREDLRGAGSNPGLCSAPSRGMNSSEDAAGGGAGGSFGGLGEAGGNGGGADGGSGASPGQLTPIRGLRGGCDGSAGGIGQGQDMGAGRPGLGGGALYLVAGEAIRITSRLDASGGGGEGAIRNQSGGGGGGSGGMIALEAPMIVLDGAQAEVSANGGGGGEGGTGATAGNDGGVSMAWNAAARGGNGNSVLGGDGGDGATRAAAAARGANGTITGANEGGGGGGGGGVGVVLTIGVVTGNAAGNVSPAPRSSL